VGNARAAAGMAGLGGKGGAPFSVVRVMGPCLGGELVRVCLRGAVSLRRRRNGAHARLLEAWVSGWKVADRQTPCFGEDPRAAQFHRHGRSAGV